MHTTNADISIEEMTKIEGAAACGIKIRDGKVTECTFAITEMRRFYEEAVRGKPASAVISHVGRICGTCSNAHILASTKAVEHALGYSPSPQTVILRKLLNYGLIIRDHGLHLYVFVLPDLYKRDSILAFDENNPEEHELVHDCFAIKDVGNKLAIAAAGRSVHAPFVRLGGFSKVPKKEELTALLPQLQKERGRVLKLIRIFLDCPFKLEQELDFLALCDDEFSFLSGTLRDSDGATYTDEEFTQKLEKVDIPYSQATGYTIGGKVFFVGALARLNLNREHLHPKTRTDAADALKVFPSKNLFHNNLAQAVEMLHAIDAATDLINAYQGTAEQPANVPARESSGIGIIEAPRGVLFHGYDINGDGTVKKATVIVPTGQNQIGIERAIRAHVEANLEKPKEELEFDIAAIVRAYDPCMSCATHFLKMKWL